MNIKEQVELIIKNPHSVLSREICTGYPYLAFDKHDYSLKHVESAYTSLVDLLKKYGYANQWEASTCSFFDVHPIFSTAEPIGGLMGLHLSLTLFDKGVAGTAQSLFFDTPSNWRKFTKIAEKRIYPTASWISYPYELFASNMDEDAHMEDIYLRNSVFLIKGSELRSVNLTAPIEFSSKLINHYKQNYDSQSLREITSNELALFKKHMIEDPGHISKFEKSALYLFMVIFCREFGIDIAIFKSIINEFDLVFDFHDQSDIIYYANEVLSHIQQLRIQIGDFNEHLLNFKQYDKTLVDSSITSEAESDVVFEVQDSPQKTYISERVRSHSLDPLHFHFDLSPALTVELECKNLIYKKWKDITQCFYFGRIDQNLYDRLRNAMNSYVADEIKNNKLLDFKNYETQERAIEYSAFNIFIKTEFELNIADLDDSNIARALFAKLTDPILTSEQKNAINVLNTASQEKLVAKITAQHCQSLINLLNLSIGKMAHPNFNKQYGPRLSKIDQDTLRQMVVQWYYDNYITEYLRLTNKFEDIVGYISRDFNNFTNNPLVEKSMLIEIKNFVKTKQNPYLLLDFSVNF